MCIAFWYTAASPPSDHGSDGNGTTTGNNASKIPKNPYAFILLSNRDLELGRPASDATFHDFEPIEIQPYGASKADATPPSQTTRDGSTSERVQTHGRKILSGRDSADSVGGTWLGLGVYQQPKLNSGRIGVLTNIHDDSPVPKGTKSRGALLKDWLRGLPQGEETVQPQIATRRYVDGLKDDAVQLAGFNLLLFDIVMKDVPSPTAEGGGKAVDRVSALQLTNRYRPSKSTHQDESVTATIPADESTLEMGDQARILPIPPDQACSMESPLGVFQAAITELKPCALRLGGMSNSLLEEPFPKVLDGLQELEGILKEQLVCEVEWTEEQEQHLLNKLFHLMKESHPIRTFQDLELSICVPLCTIPLPTASLYHSDRPSSRAAECVEDENTMTQQHHPGARKTKNPDLHIAVGAVNPHTMLSTPLVTPEPSPVKPSFRALPSVDELGTVPEHAGESSGLVVEQQSATSMVSTAAGSEAIRRPDVAAANKHYGTRLTTIILVKWNGEVTYVERDVWWQDKRGAVHNGGTGDRVFHLHL